MTKTPAELGFRMPAEWEPHQATWLSWPYNVQTWKGHLEGAEQTYAEVIAALAPHERVELLVPNAIVRRRAENKLQTMHVPKDSVRIHEIESGDVWIRDYGPIFIVDGSGRVGWTKWIYNAYGNKYADLLIGNEAPNRMPLEKFPRFDAGIVLEGGSVDVNGTGTLLTTESCLLSPDRNPSLQKKDIEKKLKDFLGVSNVLWLGSGIEGDDTTGHVDDLTRFVGSSTVITAVEKNPDDANYKPLRENAERLATMKDEKGNPLTVIEIPMPKEFSIDGRRMAASYANFYIANGVVLVPVFAQASDNDVLQTLQKCFPTRKVLGIDSREFIWGYGSIHCSTQQMPK